MKKYIGKIEILILDYHELENSPLSFIEKIKEFINSPIISKIHFNNSKPINVRRKNKNTRISHKLTLRFLLLELKRNWFGNKSLGIGKITKNFLDKIIISKEESIKFTDKEISKIDIWYSENSV